MPEFTGYLMPVFELIIGFDGVRLDDPAICRFLREVLRNRYSVGTLTGDSIDVKAYFRTRPDLVDNLSELLLSEYRKIMEIVKRSGLRYSDVHVSGWCSGDDEFCKPYWEALKKLRESFTGCASDDQSNR